MAARITGTISATGFSDLTLGGANIYQFPDGWLDPGIRDWKRAFPTEQLPNVPGRTLTDHALETITFNATLQIGAVDGSTDGVSILNALGDLLDRVSVPDWHFTFAYDSATTEWVCEPAAARPQFGKFFLFGFMVVRLTVPRWPIPVQGPF